MNRLSVGVALIVVSLILIGVIVYWVFPLHAEVPARPTGSARSGMRRDDVQAALFGIKEWIAVGTSAVSMAAGVVNIAVGLRQYRLGGKSRPASARRSSGRKKGR